MKKSTRKHEVPPLGKASNSIHINVDEIPDYVRDELAVATLKFIDNIERKKRQSDRGTSAEQGSDCGTGPQGREFEQKRTAPDAGTPETDG